MKKLTTVLDRLAFWRHRNAEGRTVGVGTVRKVAGGRQVFIEFPTGIRRGEMPPRMRNAR